jgi:hypothetical protein
MTRTELHTAVWQRPLSQLAKEWHTTDTTFRHICEQHNVPFPARGYWQKFRAGHDVRAVPLPEGRDESFSIPTKKQQPKPRGSREAPAAHTARPADANAEAVSLTSDAASLAWSMAVLEMAARSKLLHLTMVRLLDEIDHACAEGAGSGIPLRRQQVQALHAELLRRDLKATRELAMRLFGRRGG